MTEPAFDPARCPHDAGPYFCVCCVQAAHEAGHAAGQSAMLHELNQAHGVAQALERDLLHANECWEPGHTFVTEPPYEEERRQTKVHCVMCTDAAMARAKAAGVAQERARWEAALRTILARLDALAPTPNP